MKGEVESRVEATRRIDCRPVQHRRVVDVRVLLRGCELLFSASTASKPQRRVRERERERQKLAREQNDGVLKIETFFLEFSLSHFCIVSIFL